jgi:hypothetical protein
MPIPDTGHMPAAGAIYYTLYLVYADAVRGTTMINFVYAESCDRVG